jgi:hypothetical protein
MQALVEQHVAVAEFLPVGEGARVRAVALGFLVVMDIVAGLALALAPYSSKTLSRISSSLASALKCVKSRPSAFSAATFAFIASRSKR